MLLLGPPTLTAAAFKADARAVGAGSLGEVDGFADELWRLCGAAGYDPAVPAGMWCCETDRGRSAAWRTRLNPGAIGITDAWDQGLAWTSGADAAGAMMAHLSAYVRGYDHALYGVIRLDPRYTAPLMAGYGQSVRYLSDLGAGRWASDPAYAGKVAGHIERLRDRDAGPNPTPPVGAVARPEIVIREGCVNHHSRNGQAPVAIAYHITDAPNWASSDSWFLNPASRASSHVIIDRDGTIYQYVSSDRAAWTNGVYRSWNESVPWLREAVAKCDAGRANLNDFTLTIEHVGFPATGVSPAQVESSVALSRYWLDRFAIKPSRGTQIRHSDIDGSGRGYCPGALFPLGEIIRRCGGDPEAWA